MPDPWWEVQESRPADNAPWDDRGPYFNGYLTKGEAQRALARTVADRQRDGWQPSVLTRDAAVLHKVSGASKRYSIELQVLSAAAVEYQFDIELPE